MPKEKVDASQHNARAAFNDNSPSGSNQALPALLTGGGVSISSNSVNELVDPPPTIKRRAEEPCYYGKPCSDLWNTHSNVVDLRRHLHYLFKIDWPVISKLFGKYGVDHVNQNIHNTRDFIEREFAAGRKIKKSLAHCFMYCMIGVEDSEPELSPEVAAARDVTVTAGINQLKSQKKPRNDSSKYLDEYNRRRGGL
jgi:hypothetical protein|tara:strand:+ start:60 stop:647 length:588 start_codon:yes stop_codon:yes gene_type:complete